MCIFFSIVKITKCLGSQQNFCAIMFRRGIQLPERSFAFKGIECSGTCIQQDLEESQRWQVFSNSFKCYGN